MKSCIVAGKRIEYRRLASGYPREAAPPMVFLHEGLGSAATWREFPQQVANACGCEAVVYSRHGYGRSDPLDQPRRPDYLHREALDGLPEFLDRLRIERPILVGHSDGGSIALIHAGAGRWPVTAAIVMAPHVIVEAVTIEGIRRARHIWLDTDLKQRLGKHHPDPERVFLDWNDTWLDPAFRDWNIEKYLPPIACPVLAIQGEDDEYATMDQIERIGRQCRDVELLKLADCRHLPHRDQPQQVIAAIAAFVGRALDLAPPVAGGAVNADNGRRGQGR